MRDHTSAVIADNVCHAGIAAKGGNVVDDASAGLQTFLGDRGLDGID